MRGNKFELIFYLKIPGLNREDDLRATYWPISVPEISPVSQYRHLVKQSLRCEGR